MQSRENLLFSSFSHLPLQVGDFTLRPMSPGSYSLLLEIGSPLFGGGSEKPTSEEVMASVSEYVWIHAALIEQVLGVTSRADLPEKEIRKISFDLTMEDTMGFLDSFKAIANRMAAAMSEPDESEDTGKPPANVETFPTSSPAFSSPSVPPEIPTASATSSGTPPSTAPSSISTPPTSTPEPPAAGAMTSPETPVPLPDFTNPSPPSAPAT